MMSFTVRIYSYSTGQQWEYHIGGYSYTSWIAVSASLIGSNSSAPYTVRFGKEDSFDCVWIGETSSIWAHPVVTITDFSGGFANGLVSTWDDNWAVSFVTAFGTVNTSQTPSARTGNMYSDLVASSLYYSSGGSQFLFQYGNATSGAPRSINLSTSTGDPSAVNDNTGITWGTRSDSTPYYMIRCQYKSYGSYTYTRLQLNWHTGIEIGASTTYGGTRFYNDAPGFGSSTQIASIGDGDNNLRSTADIIAYASDRRLKENIVPIDKALDKVMKISGVHFDWREKTKEYGFEPGQMHDVGVIAQEIQAVLPEVVTLAPFDYITGGISKSGENFLTVKYDKIVPLLIEAIKEQQSQIENLKEKNRDFEMILDSLINTNK
jgi:hypothetical protein